MRSSRTLSPLWLSLGCVVACNTPPSSSTATDETSITGDGDADVGDGDPGDGDGDPGDGDPGDGDGDPGDGDGDPIKFDLSPNTDMQSDGGCTCSDDLKHVVCDGLETENCAPDGACAGGDCINDPCLAAELGKSSYGCDYWAVKTDLISDGTGACFAAFVANTWEKPAHIQAEYAGQALNPSAIAIPVGQGANLVYEPYDPGQGLSPGDVAVIFIARDNGFLPACPVPPAFVTNIGVVGTGRGQAVNITTDVPVVAYQILPFGGGSSAATSASLLLPTSAWDVNYVAVNAFAKSVAAPQAQPSMTIVAHEDGTQVSLLPKVAVQGGNGVAGGPAAMPIVYSLDRGETLQISQDVELTGSPLEGNHSFGLFGAASCLNIPVDGFACDSAHQQIPPIQALGSEYVGVRYRSRGNMQDEVVPWTVVGVVDGTTLDWVPAPPVGAPLVLNAGDLVRFSAPGPFVARSQDEDHPFYIAAHMTGGGTFGGEGDPEWVNIIPTAQYLDDYVLFTDPTYSETSLVVVRSPGSGGFAPVELDCLGELNGWLPLGDYEYTRVDLVTGNFMAVNGCENGRHEMWSDEPFGVTVWGWGSNASQGFSTIYVSYAYPAGASVRSINQVVIPVG
ncbi:hypothetical protein ENSA7_25890 [Enhygromyxa salina]|uniref:IgGFc-binding protein N-terminal domain-containing protein n=1 Tax=Enhygromyxa salina TaxID=215803 RepID=A0A2S9YRA9_9BACT|nr:hypothetical protein ENSA7_25890 [Enhygromyxa salina]